MLTSVPCKFALTNMSLRLGIRFRVKKYEHIEIPTLIAMDKFIVEVHWALKPLC